MAVKTRSGKLANLIFSVVSFAIVITMTPFIALGQPVDCVAVIVKLRNIYPTAELEQSSLDFFLEVLAISI